MTKPAGTRALSRERREQALELLRAAQTLVATRAQWTHHAYARDRWSNPISTASPRARRFCAAGALLRADCDLPSGRARGAGAGAAANVPPRVGIAAESLVRAAGHAYLARVHRHRLDPSRAIRVLEVFGGSPIAWFQLLVKVNDAGGFRYRDLEAGFTVAIAVLENSLRPSGSSGSAPSTRHGRGTSAPEKGEGS